MRDLFPEGLPAPAEEPSKLKRRNSALGRQQRAIRWASMENVIWPDWRDVQARDPREPPTASLRVIPGTPSWPFGFSRILWDELSADEKRTAERDFQRYLGGMWELAQQRT